MSSFTCHVQLDGGEAQGLSLLRGLDGGECLARRTTRLRESGISAYGVARNRHEIPSSGRVGSWIAFGDARLQNRTEVAARLQVTSGMNDLELLTASLQRYGPAALRQCYGAYAFAIADIVGRKVMLVRDAMGLQSLFYTRRGIQIAIASVASPLLSTDEFDLEYIADTLANGANRDARTIYRGVRGVPPGSVVTIDTRGESRSEYWSPYEFGPENDWALDDAAERFGALFRDAVVADHTGTTETWAALSGGLDSSSIVCQAESLTRQGIIGARLGGTISLYDTIGKADERRYSDAVVDLHGLPNEQVATGWPWRGFSSDAPPIPDQPNGMFLVRDTFNRVADIIDRSGGCVYLDGLGADHYLGENLSFLADHAAHGRLVRAAQEVVRWSVAKRTSVWRTSYRHVLSPMLPARWTARHLPPTAALPSWLRPDFVQRFDMDLRLVDIGRMAGRLGHKYQDSVAYDLRHLSAQLNGYQFEQSVTTRYPFLYQPLLEFTLRLPPHIRCEPLLPKRVLRQAMQGILPELIRQRPSKGATGTRASWALKYERGCIAQLMRDPILAQLGCVDPFQLRRHFAFAKRGRGPRILTMYPTLVLETWLQIRAGRWRIESNRTSDIERPSPIAASN